jgi:hypothetical protein
MEGPSEDLLARTMAAIPDGLPPGPDVAGGHPPPARLTDVDRTLESGRSVSRWNLMDSVGGLLSAATLLALLLPTIAAGRFEARKIACQDQLRDFGTALTQFVHRDRHERLPQVAQSGPEAFAGVYANRLSDAGLLPDAGRRWCPSADLPDWDAPESGEPDPVNALTSLPPVASLERLSVNELKQIQRIAGGHYAYTLGVIGEHGFSSPRYEARASFAIMADAPLGQAPGSDDVLERRYSHGGVGINVLYEDGSVRFIRADALDTMPDHPFVNHEGVSEAGVNIDDASLSPSWRPPFVRSIQR